MGTYICKFFEEKRKEWIFVILSNFCFRDHCGHFMEFPTKRLELYKVGHWKISQLKFSIISGWYTTIKEEEGRRWRKKICSKPLPSPLPYHPIEVPQQVQTSSSFKTDYIGKGVEEIQLVKQVRMVSRGVPRGFWQFSICQAADGFDQQIGWWGGHFWNNIISWRGSGSKDNKYR